MRVADALVRLALRLSAVGVMAPVAKMVASGEVSGLMVGIAAASGAAVGGLLFLAHRLNNNDKR